MRSGGTERSTAQLVSRGSDISSVEGRREVRGDLAPITTKRSPSCALWGVLNVTQDSFSDGGRFIEPRAAVEHAGALLAQGANVIDIGGASSRPAGNLYGAGAALVSPQQELERVSQVVAAVAEMARASGAKVSIDTTHALVARGAIERGARIVNDVSGATNDALLELVAQAGVEYVVMHTRGRGEVSAAHIGYRDVCEEVCRELLKGAERACMRGIARDRIWLDPGIGFAKTAAQSAELLAQLERIVALGFPVLVGASRKGFIAELAPRASGERPAPEEREAGSVAVLTVSVLKGASAVRVHDVAGARQAVLIAEALGGSRAIRDSQIRGATGC